MDKKKYTTEVEKYLCKEKAHKKPYTYEVEGISLKIYPGVFSPKYFPEGAWFGKKLQKIAKNKSFLEIGCGSGITSILVVKGGGKVTAVDVNKDAVSNTRENAKNLNISLKAIKSNLFSNLKGKKFDIIFWNHPYFEEFPPVNNRSVFDYNFKLLHKYFRESHKYLTKQGALLLGSSEFVGADKIKKLAKLHGWKSKILASKRLPIATGSRLKERLMIFYFRK